VAPPRTAAGAGARRARRRVRKAKSERETERRAAPAPIAEAPVFLSTISTEIAFHFELICIYCFFRRKIAPSRAQSEIEHLFELIFELVFLADLSDSQDQFQIGISQKEFSKMHSSGDFSVNF
jgi:hypothetical protein